MYSVFKLCLIMAFPNIRTGQSVPSNSVAGGSYPLNFIYASRYYVPPQQEGCSVSLVCKQAILLLQQVSAGIFTGVESEKNSLPPCTLFTVWFQETAPSWWKVPAIMHLEVLGFKLFQQTRRVLLRELYSPECSLPSARIQTPRIDFLFLFFFF